MARSGRRQYAKGRHALAECQRSGQKMRYRDLVEDGHVPGLLVHPDWWEPKHPQEIPPNMDDPVALWRPAPEISKPPGEGDDPRTGCCNLDPAYQENTTTSGAVPTGATQVGINDALRFDDARGEEGFVYIQMDNNDWWCSPIVVPIQCTPTYTINLAYPFDGPSPISAGAKVVAGSQSTYVLAAAAVPASLTEVASADSASSAIQINAVGGCPPYLYEWEWVTQPDPLITITSPTSDNSTLTIGSLADGTYEGELLVTITDTAQTPQEVEVRIPVSLQLAVITQIILGAPDETTNHGQTLLVSNDDMVTLADQSLNSPQGDDWDNILIGSAGDMIFSMGNEQEGWVSFDNGTTWEEISYNYNLLFSFGNGGGNSIFSKSITYGGGAPLDVTSIVKADDVSAIVDGMGTKTISTSGASPPVYDGVTAHDISGASGSISLQGSSTSYMRAYNATEGLFDTDEWTLEFSYLPSTNDKALDASTERVLLHSDLAWGTKGSWYIYVQSALSGELTYGIVVHDGVSFEAAASGMSAANQIPGPNGWNHITVTRWDNYSAGGPQIKLMWGAFSGDVIDLGLAFGNPGDGTFQIDSNFRIGGDGSGSTAGRNDTNLGYADGNIDEIRITRHYSRTAGFQQGIGQNVQNRYQKTRWPTTGEEMVLYNRTEPAGRGTMFYAQADPRLHQGASNVYMTTSPEPTKFVYGMALHKGEMFFVRGDLDIGAAANNSVLRIYKYDTDVVLTPQLVTQITEVVNLFTVRPSSDPDWGFNAGEYAYTFPGQNGQFGGATWIASDGTNLYAVLYNYTHKKCANVYSTDDGASWNTNTNQIVWTSDTLDWPRQLLVDADGYGYMITFGGVWRSDAALTTNPTWSYTNVRSTYLSNRGNVKRGEIINGKLYIVGQSDFSPAQAMVGFSTDRGATFTIKTDNELAALSGIRDLFTLGQNPP